MTAPASLALAAARRRHSRRRNGGEPDPKLVLLLTSGALFASILDLAAVNIAFPDMRADFPSASLPTLSWVVTAYGVLFAALLPTAGLSTTSSTRRAPSRSISSVVAKGWTAAHSLGS